VPTSPILRAAAAFVHGLLFRSRLSLQIEVLALRHQLAVHQRTAARPRLKPADRILWAWLSRAWSGWREALVILKPETVIAWRRRMFRQHWARLSRSGKPGRPAIQREIRDLIRRMSSANPLWCAPRIVGEPAKIAVDFFVVPTVRNQILFVFLVLAHERRRVLHFNVTANPTAATTTAGGLIRLSRWTAP
jgi:putative transposase